MIQAKRRQRNSHPQLVFHTPRICNLSEIVYADTLFSLDLVDEHMASNHFDHDVVDDGDGVDEIEKESECKEEHVLRAKSSSLPSFNEVQISYHASMLSRTKSNKPSLDIPWPALAADITDENVKRVVDPTVFNFLAWICGFSKDLILDA